MTWSYRDTEIAMLEFELKRYKSRVSDLQDQLDSVMSYFDAAGFTDTHKLRGQSKVFFQQLGKVVKERTERIVKEQNALRMALITRHDN